MKHILFYSDRKIWGNDTDSSTYVHNALARYPDEFALRVCHEPRPELAREADIVFARFENPINRSFLEALCEYEQQGTIFFNSPKAQLNLGTKKNLKYFKGTDVIPPTYISSNPVKLAQFARALKNGIIVKPVDLFGGAGVAKYDHWITSTNDLIYMVGVQHTARAKNEVVMQEFVPAVTTTGDRRINVFMYEPVSALPRIPKEGEIVANVTAGGRLTYDIVTDEDRALVTKIIPFLRANGIRWAGVDRIGNYACEINIISPGGIGYDKGMQTEEKEDMIVDLVRLAA
ncbi:hypothetical protein ACFL0V_00960 [Nanoarchaeota archaeon]